MMTPTLGHIQMVSATGESGKITASGGKWGKLPALDGNVTMGIALKLLNP